MSSPDPATSSLPASDDLVQALYAELRDVASRERWRLGNAQTLQTTALISETWLKLHKVQAWQDRSHFLRAAAIAMRQVLVDAARERYAAKRGGGLADLTLSIVERMPAGSDEELLHVDEALRRLQDLEPRLAQVVECRFFAGYSEAETAEVLGIAERTVRRDWLKAKAWLYVELSPENA
ncbi:MAG: sigma-70 family RNA polymerase sigma factor [Proteobacteria bacterium]|nr:sigma-70 family RNA polymerase sigma factor [Pseudomonadota bacterium]